MFENTAREAKKEMGGADNRKLASERRRMVFFDLLRKIVSLKAAEGKVEVSAPSVGNCCVIQ
ncbi:unnamed protein product [Timema podura]|uniref:Uncharacterized protein n=1 Tax=Timema podura TaxID=61482 RepID=A0ABN7NZS2_TIMPD|nr:unnamed protein product [Timema podura]